MRNDHDCNCLVVISLRASVQAKPSSRQWFYSRSPKPSVNTPECWRYFVRFAWFVRWRLPDRRRKLKLFASADIWFVKTFSSPVENSREWKSSSPFAVRRHFNPWTLLPAAQHASAKFVSARLLFNFRLRPLLTTSFPKPSCWVSRRAFLSIFKSFSNFNSPLLVVALTLVLPRISWHGQLSASAHCFLTDSSSFQTHWRANCSSTPPRHLPPLMIFCRIWLVSCFDLDLQICLSMARASQFQMLSLMCFAVNSSFAADFRVPLRLSKQSEFSICRNLIFPQRLKLHFGFRFAWLQFFDRFDIDKSDSQPDLWFPQIRLVCWRFSQNSSRAVLKWFFKFVRSFFCFRANWNNFLTLDRFEWNGWL